MTMDQDVSRVGADEWRSESGILDAGRFARSLRRLAIETHEILNRPDAATGELTGLRWRFEQLLRVARGSRLTEIERWLRSARRALDARLLSRLVVSPEPTES
jgi:hypothetical protein